jgi:hypothetical protein
MVVNLATLDHILNQTNCACAFIMESPKTEQTIVKLIPEKLGPIKMKLF